ncbi:uncharacterized protein K441DRAFT_651012 [Cenococcum geophilum 1.58]|uniref:uncharacterized protein n=1 Tax=Cenococcum geophilum 1.58 TaxID=794803 RepID=UPI00358EFC4A|nr:hypothetical protein K441DRAFT_651012 [Cenococcum geophilum 1.58]
MSKLPSGAKTRLSGLIYHHFAPSVGPWLDNLANRAAYRPRPIKVVHQAQGWLKVYKFLNAQHYGMYSDFLSYLFFASLAPFYMMNIFYLTTVDIATS